MRKFIRGFGFAFKGLTYATKTQLNFRVHLGATLLAVIAGFALKLSVSEWLWIILSCTVVLVTELLNTSIEILTDFVSPGYHKLAGHVKDVAASAVVIAALFALITGIIIFLPKVLLLIGYAA